MDINKSCIYFVPKKKTTFFLIKRKSRITNSKNIHLSSFTSILGIYFAKPKRDETFHPGGSGCWIEGLMRVRQVPCH